MFLPRDTVSILVTPPLDTNAYATGDLLFAPIKLQNATLNTMGGSIMRGLVILDSSNNKQAIDLLFFDSDPGSLAALNAAITVSAAQLAKLVGSLTIATGDYITLQATTNAMATKIPNLTLSALKGSKDFWMAAIIRGTSTYAASDLSFKAIFERQG